MSNTPTESPSGGGRRRRRRRKPAEAAEAWSLDDFAVEPQEGETRFHDLGLRDELMHAIADLGFQYCSPIQGQVLPHTLQGHDAIGKAQTGTGKTAAFLITIFNDMLCHPPEGERFLGEPRALVIAPTRELALQVKRELAWLYQNAGAVVASTVGGMDMRDERRGLAR
ncbi:MAG: DEAD/DEAH box helicase, partial [Halioglobus sp.]